jgi:hypothetical protein
MVAHVNAIIIILSLHKPKDIQLVPNRQYTQQVNGGAADESLLTESLQSV